MVTMTEYKLLPSGTGDNRLWEASCCSRYVRRQFSVGKSLALELSNGMYLFITTNKNSSGMTWATSPFEGCMKTFDTSVTAYRDLILITLTETAKDGRTIPITSHVTGDHENSTVLTTGTMVADEVVIYWQATDLSKFDEEYASMPARRLYINFTLTPTATASNPSDTEKKTSGLSTGAKAGIGVGVAVVVVLFCVGGFLLFRGRHSKETKTFLKNDQPELVQAGPSEMAA
jgi:hypothetical protein